MKSGDLTRFVVNVMCEVLKYLNMKCKAEITALCFKILGRI